MQCSRQGCQQAAGCRAFRLPPPTLRPRLPPPLPAAHTRAGRRALVSIHRFLDPEGECGEAGGGRRGGGRAARRGKGGEAPELHAAAED